jgi:uncharacterized protein (TIGR02246 family)
MTRLARRLSAALIAAGAALPLAADEAADEAAIRDLWQAYQTSRVEGDADTWLGLWHPEGIQMPPGVPARGFDAVEEGVRASFAPGVVDSMEIDPQEIQVLGDWAYARGVYTSARTVDGEEVEVDGKFMTILRRQDDGSWRIYRDIFNSNTP